MSDYALLATVALVAGLVIGYIFRAVSDADVMQADADELAMLRQINVELGERIAELEEDGGDWSWTEEPVGGAIATPVE